MSTLTKNHWWSCILQSLHEWLRDQSVIFHDCICIQCLSAISYCTSELQFVACVDVCVCVRAKSGTRKKAQMRHCWWRFNLAPGIYKYTLQTMERKYLSTGDCPSTVPLGTQILTSAWWKLIQIKYDKITMQNLGFVSPVTSYIVH